MLNRLFPIFILFCILGLALFTYLSWRSTERTEQESASSAPSQGHARTSHATEQQLQLIEAYTLRAEAAAARAQLALEKIEALAISGGLPAAPTAATGLPLPPAQP